MLKKYILFFVIVVLAGCGEKKVDQVKPPSVATARHFYKNSIYLPDGAGLQFSGKLRRYELIENEKGQFDRYTFEFSEDIMAIEGAVFATLAKSGYQRKVRREDDRLYVVNYIKKGFAPVSMTYERMPAKKKVQAFTRVRVAWKNA